MKATHGVLVIDGKVYKGVYTGSAECGECAFEDKDCELENPTLCICQVFGSYHILKEVTRWE